MKTRQAALRNYEPTSVVRERDDTDEADKHGKRRRAGGEGDASHSRSCEARREQQSTRATKGAELWRESKTIARMADADARKERQSHADVVAM